MFSYNHSTFKLSIFPTFYHPEGLELVCYLLTAGAAVSSMGGNTHYRGGGFSRQQESTAEPCVQEQALSQA